MVSTNLEVPSITEAINLLKEASELNPGPWVEHSYKCAEAAKRIATHIDGLDSERAYILGLLHDIGRRVGVHKMRHGLDGYSYAMSLGYSHVSRICLTHII